MTPRVAILGLVFLLVAPALGSREGAFIGYTELKGKKVVLTTQYGKIAIHLLPNLAPETVAAVHALAEARVCPDCRFYRSEEPPPRGSTGPPYGLLQGSLAGLPAIPPPEGGMVAKRGHVCLIPHTKEFFISLIDHSDWGKAHTVFGEVDPKDMDKAVKKLLKQPWHEYRHPEFGTLMRMLDTEAPFTIGLAGDKTAT